ncbi:hypothetical protein GQ602_005380 [Ophiocordyceps camponoti-floridani]|uniref:Uncharacterized protein n=1 Tax=Ophiocordyceps camponoti-floridani TaxID=2030778 RepID=A0A8H4Q631_9HYPO|nr:hypothetical protein GQ602_005380 [Ophiocordyceps camponoti-floridani]
MRSRKVRRADQSIHHIARGQNQDPGAYPYYPPHGPYPHYNGFYPPPPNYGPINNYYNHISPSYKFHSVTNKKDPQLAPDLNTSGIPTTAGYVDNSSGNDSTDNRGSNGGTYVGVNSAAFVDKGATSIGTDSRGYKGHYSDSRGQNSHDFSSSDSRGRQAAIESGGSRGKVGAQHSTTDSEFRRAPNWDNIYADMPHHGTNRPF